MQFPDMIADQLLFQQTFGHGVLPSPKIPDPTVQMRRIKLVREEFSQEFSLAWDKCARAAKVDPDRLDLEQHVEALAELGDAIADSIYVLIGTAFEYGIPLDKIWNAVQAANMGKLWTYTELINRFPEEMASALAPPITLNNGWVVTIPGGNPPRTSEHRAYNVKDTIGKVQKPPGFTPPDIKQIIRDAITRGTNA